MQALPLPPSVLRIFGLLLEERAGLSFRPEDADMLAEKLSPRALELGFDSLLEYYYFLKYDEQGPEELDSLVESLVIHETYFFRELAQLRALVDHLLPPLAPLQPLQVWCAGAATGEEPYTLAMLLAERGLLERVSILGTDISHKALERARRGEYGERSLRATPPGIVGKWLHRQGNKVVIDQRLREVVRWARVNLVHEETVRGLGPFNAILCRNVLIYFAEETVSRVVNSLAARLQPGGYLLVGASESLMRFGTHLVPEELGGAFFYRRVS